MASCRIESVTLRKGHGGLYKAPTKEERSEQLRGERDQIKFIDLRLLG